MSREDIQYMPLTTDPSRRIRDLAQELTQANICWPEAWMRSGGAGGSQSGSD